MPCDLVALAWDANEPQRLARFWAGLLGWGTDDDGTTLVPDDDTGFALCSVPTGEPKTGPNRAHPDLTSTSLEDQDQETAIRSPHGRLTITWGGPPVEPEQGRNRLRLDVAPPAGADREAEVERLVSLGATRLGSARGPVEMTDPDGNEFRVLPRA